MKIGELFVDLGFKADTIKLKDFVKSIGDLNMASVIAATGYGALYEAAKKVIGIADEIALGVNMFSRETGLSTKEMQQWSVAAAEMGIESGQVAADMAKFQDQEFRLSRGLGEGSNAWNLARINPIGKSFVGVLKEMAVKWEGMSKAEQRFHLENLNYSTKYLNLIERIRKEGTGFIDKEGFFSQENLDRLDKFYQVNEDLGYNLKMIWADVGAAILPTVKYLADISDSIAKASQESWKFKGALDAISELLDITPEGFKKKFKHYEKLLPGGKGFNPFWSIPVVAAGALATQGVRTAGAMINATIHVHESKDARATGVAVAEELDKVYRRTVHASGGASGGW